jgi:hypothetical protein
MFRIIHINKNLNKKHIIKYKTEYLQMRYLHFDYIQTFLFVIVCGGLFEWKRMFGGFLLLCLYIYMYRRWRSNHQRGYLGFR